MIYCEVGIVGVKCCCWTVTGVREMTLNSFVSILNYICCVPTLCQLIPLNISLECDLLYCDINIKTGKKAFRYQFRLEHISIIEQTNGQTSYWPQYRIFKKNLIEMWLKGIFCFTEGLKAI